MNVYNLMIVIFLVMSVILLFIKKITNRRLKLFIGILLITLTAFPMIIYPHVTSKIHYNMQTFDFYRYYWQIDMLRLSNFDTVINFLFEKPWFIFRIIQLLVAKISNNNSLLFMIIIPIIVSIFGYFLIDNMKYDESKNNIRLYILSSLFVFISIINSNHMFSGLRNALSISIFSYGYYLIKEKNNKIGIFLIILSIFVHPSALIYLLILYIEKYEKNKRTTCVLMLFSGLIYVALTKFIDLQSDFVILEKIQYYSNESNYYNKKILILELIQLLSIISIIRDINKKNTKLSFLYYSCLFVVGFIFKTTFFVRVRFILAFLFPFIVKNAYNEHIEIKNRTIVIILVSSLISLIYYLDFINMVGGAII